MRPFTDIPAEELACTRYNLVANIRHNENRKELIDQGDTGFYNVHVLHKVQEDSFMLTYGLRQLTSGTISKI